MVLEKISLEITASRTISFRDVDSILISLNSFFLSELSENYYKAHGAVFISKSYTKLYTISARCVSQDIAIRDLSVKKSKLRRIFLNSLRFSCGKYYFYSIFQDINWFGDVSYTIEWKKILFLCHYWSSLRNRNFNRRYRSDNFSQQYCPGFKFIPLDRPLRAWGWGWWRRSPLSSRKISRSFSAKTGGNAFMSGRMGLKSGFCRVSPLPYKILDQPLLSELFYWKAMWMCVRQDQSLPRIKRSF